MSERLTTREMLLKLSVGQDAVLGRAQLAQAGFPTARIDTARRYGLLRPVFHGSYAVGREVELTRSVWRAGVISAGRGAVLMGRSAAEAWGILEPKRGLPRVVEVGRPGRARVLRARSPAIPQTRLVILSRTFYPGEVQELDGLPVTSPGRTFIDLSVALSPGARRRFFVEACRLGLIRKHDLRYLVARSRGLPGAGWVREATGLWVPGIEETGSVLEALFLTGWAAHDSRLPEVNQPLGPWTVDFLWRKERVVVETDGRAFHSHPIARGRDGRKDEWLRNAGYTPLRFGFADVDRHMDLVHARVRSVLDRHPNAQNRRT